MANSKIYNIFLVLIGVLVGTFAAYLCKNVSFLSWLAFGVDFGLESPLVLDLSVVKLTFGISVNLSLSVVLFVILSLIIGRAIAK